MRNVFLMNQRLSSIVLLTSLICPTVFALPSDGRYEIEPEGATTAQKDLLSQTIEMRFAPNVKTLGDAIATCLQWSGYRLVDPAKQSAALKQTLSKPLPVVDRVLKPMSLREALGILMGSPFTLVEDELERTINFAVKRQYTQSVTVHRKHT